jgi:hypothetical protein
VRKLAAAQSQQEPIECRPADLLPPRLPKLREELRAKGLPSDDEHCVIYAMFPQELEKYYAARGAAGGNGAAHPDASAAPTNGKKSAATPVILSAGPRTAPPTDAAPTHAIAPSSSGAAATADGGAVAPATAASVPAPLVARSQLAAGVTDLASSSREFMLTIEGRRFPVKVEELS